LGALSTIVTFISGKQAAASVDIPSAAYPVLNHHADLALITMLFFTIYAVIRTIFFNSKFAQIKILEWVLILIGLGGYYYVVETATHGAELVFNYGLGTQAVNKPEEPQTLTGFSLESDGSWSWQASANAVQDFKNNFSLIKGNSNDLSMQIKDSVLVLNIKKESPVLFVAGVNILQSAVNARVDLDNFNGEFRLVQNVADSSNFSFFSIDDRKGSLGKLTDSQNDIMEESEIKKQKGWINIKSVASEGHYRGYVNDELVAHGHGSPMPSGRAGIFLSGKGKIRIDRIQLVAINNSG